jgi:mono/diheme cytochrome c family protein
MSLTSVFLEYKVTRKKTLFLLMGLMSWLFALPQALYAASPEENGKTLYQAYCVACHTIGGGKLVGPDLKGVIAKREESWLVRWIREPDKMAAEGDPIVIPLLKEFNNLPMPNFGLSEAQAKDILAYIEETESQGSGATATATTKPVPATTTTTAPPTQVGAKRFSGNADNGKTIFQQKCFYCHTIGGGQLAGPDLKEVIPQREENWLVRWIVDPNKMVAEGDPIALGLLPHYRNVTMPTLNLSEAEARDVLTYIEAQSASQTVDDEELLIAEGETLDEGLITPSKPAGDPKIGKALFLGQKSFASGAPSCISCHSNTEIGGLGGGTLGPDLTKVYSRYGGDIGLSAVLLSMPFPTMQPVFSKQTVLDSEVAHLNAYFAQTDQLDEKPLDVGFLWLGLLGVAIFYILVHIIWRDRLTSVRKTMVGR